MPGTEDMALGSSVSQEGASGSCETALSSCVSSAEPWRGAVSLFCPASVDLTCSEVLVLSKVCGAQRLPGKQSLQPCCGGSPAWVPDAPASVGTSDAQGHLGGKLTVDLQGTVALTVPLQMRSYEAYPLLGAGKGAT